MGKFSLLLGGGIGYVLGARGGRDHYDKIMAAAQRAKENPKVAEATEAAAHKGGQVLREAKDKAAEKAPDWMPGSTTADEPVASANGAGAHAGR